jgi:mannose-6-phosphate isomerase-like protein (cupin superfamily)
MKSKLLPLLSGTLLVLAGLATADTASEHHVLASGAAVKWGPPPPTLPPGAQLAVIDGDPASKGLVTLRARLPSGYKIPAHWHPTDEHITVLSGSLGIGMGDMLDTEHGQTLKAGGYAVAPANMHHYAWTTSGATIQLHMIGPFAITYVNPADDPSRSGAK